MKQGRKQILLKIISAILTLFNTSNWRAKRFIKKS